MTNIGRVVYWYCNWYFGRDDYETKTIIQEWTTRLVTIDDDKNISFCKFESEEEKEERIKEREVQLKD